MSQEEDNIADIKCCGSCGSEMRSDSRYCSRCGHESDEARGESGEPPPTDGVADINSVVTGGYYFQPVTMAAPYYVQPHQQLAQNSLIPRARYDGMSIASMVLGIVAIVIYPSGIICGPLGIVFSRRGKDNLYSDPTLQGMAFTVAGLVCGIVGLVLSTVFWLVIIIAALAHI